MLLFIKNKPFQQLNVVCFWGASPPRPLTRGFAPGPPLGAKPPDPLIASRCRARHEQVHGLTANLLTHPRHF